MIQPKVIGIVVLSAGFVGALASAIYFNSVTDSDRIDVHKTEVKPETSSSLSTRIPAELEVDKAAESPKESTETRFSKDEQEFRQELVTHFSDWEKLKELVAAREVATNTSYSDLLLKIGIGNGQITGPEIASLIRGGEYLDDQSFDALIFSGNTAAFTYLGKRGLISDVNARSQVSGLNVIGDFVIHVGHFPSRYSTTQVNSELRQLINIGVNPTDGLSAALSNVNPSNAELRLSIAQLILDSGVNMSPEQVSLVEEMRDRPYKNDWDRSYKNDFLALLTR